MRILRASDTALLVEAADLAEAMRLNLSWTDVAGVRELIPGARTVLVRFDPAQISAGELAADLRAAPVQEALSAHSRQVSIAVHYDGQDLTEVAEILGVAAETVIARHLAVPWQVAFSGFAPGFGYAVSSDPLFDVPRRSSPRTKVPAGSVGLAGPFTGIYPRESPGGWQLIGRTDERLWDLDREPPALLAPGTEVTFQRAPRPVANLSATTHTTTHDADRTASGVPAPEGDAAAPSPSNIQDGPYGAAGELRVTQSGVQTLVQDLGRPGHAALGVCASGTADRIALRAANRAVGNAPGEPVLECVGAVSLAYAGPPTIMAVMGAEGEVALHAADGVEHAVSTGAAFAVEDGDHITMQYPSAGLRYLVAVRGGIAAPRALNSSASDTLAGLGPAALHTGDRIPVGDPGDAPNVVELSGGQRHLPQPGESVELAITLGPRDDWFTAAAVQTLLEQDWEVTQRSDRVGLRLAGETPLERALDGELPSEGAVTGAIQVPPDGQPVLFLPDHPLTGGYPIIGAVTDDHLDLAGQLPPGTRIRFYRDERAERIEGEQL
ncbi:urea amidolyase family protein [Kocuria sp.]|uniref:5-oxoprolinase subunit B/C family protein n=1 Tax=Kocuria sp. TaxID=1871328 RepID=UPI0026DFC5B9|nr:urea amidolyase family protein [Kocuria sp.]MDO5617567.1 urea amidolyase family protein [Kocuria sp.]